MYHYMYESTGEHFVGSEPLVICNTITWHKIFPLCAVLVTRRNYANDHYVKISCYVQNVNLAMA